MSLRSDIGAVGAISVSTRIVLNPDPTKATDPVIRREPLRVELWLKVSRVDGVKRTTYTNQTNVQLQGFLGG